MCLRGAPRALGLLAVSRQADQLRLQNMVHELDRRVKRLRREIESQSMTNLSQIAKELRRIQRDEIDALDRLSRKL